MWVTYYAASNTQIGAVQAMMRERFAVATGILSSSTSTAASLPATAATAAAAPTQLPTMPPLTAEAAAPMSAPAPEVCPPAAPSSTSSEALQQRGSPYFADFSLTAALTTLDGTTTPMRAGEATTMSAMPAMVETTTAAGTAATEAAAAAPLPLLEDWRRSDGDAEMRQTMGQRLVELFHARRPSMEDAFKARLPRLVRKLEEGLYRSAVQREQYEDAGTLEARVHGLVRQLMGRYSGAHAFPPAAGGQDQGSLLMMTSAAGGIGGGGGGGGDASRMMGGGLMPPSSSGMMMPSSSSGGTAATFMWQLLAPHTAAAVAGPPPFMQQQQQLLQQQHQQRLLPGHPQFMAIGFPCPASAHFLPPL